MQSVETQKFCIDHSIADENHWISGVITTAVFGNSSFDWLIVGCLTSRGIYLIYIQVSNKFKDIFWFWFDIMVFNPTKIVFMVQRARHSPNTISALFHGQALDITVCDRCVTSNDQLYIYILTRIGYIRWDDNDFQFALDQNT